MRPLVRTGARNKDARFLTRLNNRGDLIGLANVRAKRANLGVLAVMDLDLSISITVRVVVCILINVTLRVSSER